MNTDQSEQTSLEILRDFAKNSGRKIETTSERLSSTGYLSFQQTKRTAIIPCQSNEELFFYWYNNPKSFSPLSMYCGVFFESNVADVTQISMRKKSFFDRFSPFSSGNTNKTGDFTFDHNIIIKGDGFESIQKVIKRQNVQHNISEIIDTDQRFRIEINLFSPDFGPLLNKKSIVCIYIKDFWILESKVIEKIFKLSTELKEDFFNKNKIF
jgi:hypothetical protein